MPVLQRVALLYLLVMFVAAYGYAVGRFKVFPHAFIEPIVQEISDFVAGDAMERNSSPIDKLTSDLGLSYGRWLYNYPELAARNTTPVAFESGFDGKVTPLVYIDGAHRSGYRVIVGILDQPGGFWGALLLDPQGQVVHNWRLSTAHIDKGSANDRIKNLYGVHVTPSGSVIFNMQEAGAGIVRVDACSDIEWTLEGSFHHTVSPDENGNFWTFIGGQNDFDQNMALVSLQTGQIVRTIDMGEVRKRNPNLRIWDLYPLIISDREKVRYQRNLTHGNDIEPLPAALAQDFPAFEPGDLAISYATTNLVFVLDPDTLEVKWWRAGLGDLQHDVDWEAGGNITLFNNNSRRLFKPYSDIVTIDTASMDFTIDVDGEGYDFYSVINGRHQLTPQGTRFVTSSTQGWAFELDRSGEIVFSYINNISKQDSHSLHLAEALRYQEDYFHDEFWKKCGGQPQ